MSGKIIKYLGDLLLNEKMWSGDVETKWEPKEGFFNQSAEKIASGLKRNSKDLKQAMSRLNFYINRGGENLSAEDKSRLENAKEKLRTMYESMVTEASEGTTSPEPTTAKNSSGKKFRIYNISASWVALIPEDGEVSDKIKVPIGDFWEDYTAYDSEGKEIKKEPVEEAIKHIGSQSREKLEDLKDIYTIVKKTPKEVILHNKESNKDELWFLNDHAASYVIEIDGKGYEFAHSIDESTMTEARTIGVKYKNLLKKLVQQAQNEGNSSNDAVFNYVKEKLPQEAFDTWEGAYNEIEMLVSDTLSNQQ